MLKSWGTNPIDEATRAACDWRSYCPGYNKQTVPRLPWVKPKTGRTS